MTMISSTSRGVFIRLCALSFLAAPAVTSHAQTTQPSVREVRVSVVEATHTVDIKGARVFVVGQDGRELATAKADDYGRAVLRVPSGSRPKYVFAEHPQFFITGLQWRDAAVEYYLVTTVLKLP